MVNLEVGFKVKRFMRIGEVAKIVGISSSTIRYYERQGLLNTNSISRSENGYRMYQQQDIDEIRLILRFKKFGLELNAIKVLLGKESKKCGNLVESVDEQLAKCRQMEELIKARISSLKVAKESCISNCEQIGNVRKCCA